jgi:hypothetical protein
MGGIYPLFWWRSMVECEKRPALVYTDGRKVCDLPHGGTLKIEVASKQNN